MPRTTITLAALVLLIGGNRAGALTYQAYFPSNTPATGDVNTIPWGPGWVGSGYTTFAVYPAAGLAATGIQSCMSLSVLAIAPALNFSPPSGTIVIPTAQIYVGHLAASPLIANQWLSNLSNPVLVWDTAIDGPMTFPWTQDQWTPIPARPGFTFQWDGIHDVAFYVANGPGWTDGFSVHTGDGLYYRQGCSCYPVTPGVTNPTAVGSAGMRMRWTFNAGACIAPNDECSAPVPLTDGENGPFDNTMATDSAGFATTCGILDAGHKDVFFSYTAPSNADVSITTCDPPGFTGTNTDTQITVHATADCPVPMGLPIACNDTSQGCGSGLQAAVMFTMTTGTNYLVRVASSQTISGTFKITVTPHVASVTIVGTGCTLPLGVPPPSLGLSGQPIIGSTRMIGVLGSVPLCGGYISISNPGAPHPYFPGGPCLSYLDPSSTFTYLSFMTNANGDRIYTDTIPNVAWLDGLIIYVQAFVTCGQQLQSTNALEVKFGYQ
jgi:hypothetical protein